MTPESISSAPMSSPSPDVYMSGALSAPSEDRVEYLKEEVYNRVYDVCDGIGLNCYCPHKSETDPSKPMVHSKIWKTDYERVASVDAVVAYVGEPALGVGAEIEMARTSEVPVVLLSESERQENLSRLIIGNPAVRDIVLYEEPVGMEEELEDLLIHIFNKQSLEDTAMDEDWSVKKLERMRDILDDQQTITEGQVLGHRQEPKRPLTKEDWKELASEEGDGEQLTLD